MNADRTLLTDAQWARLAPLLPGQAHSPGVTAKDTRLFVEAILWRLRCGVPWRDLPERFGPWHRVFVRFSRWKHSGVWAKALAALQDETGLSQLQVDSTIVRAHQHAAGALKKKGPQALGRSRGGFSTKLHLSCDAQGRPRQLALTGGQAGDCPHAPALLVADLRAGQHVLADRAYDANYLREQITQAGAQAVIPSKKNRKVPIAHDAQVYKNRNQIERCFNRLKAYRAIANRFEKTALAYLALVTLAAIRMWL
ncbi:IS5 family transposase [Hymenobacter amundsenii]|uniref:IS5 family transposase n=1 Tax=Hymenobacter amundsenii TaxID=2006685 RepID=UPI003742217B